MFLFLTSLVFFSFATSSFAISCLSMNGNPIDSWTIFKAPKTSDLFLFAEENSSLTQPSVSLNSTTNGALALTLQQLWSSSDVSFLLYNDEPPMGDSYNFTVGHAKGVLALETTATGETEGFFLLHSIPKFPLGPLESSSYVGLLENAYTYGQNAYCVSITGETADRIAYGLHLVLPNIYEIQLTNEVKENFPNITSLAKGEFSKAPLCVFHELETKHGLPFTFFSKSTQWNNDLWSACISPQLQVNLEVESWIRGSAIGPSCSEYDVTDVKNVAFYDFPSFTWSSYDDHSKWAVGVNWTCHGDINRMTTQFTRGGGAMCVKGIGYLLQKDITSSTHC